MERYRAPLLGQVDRQLPSGAKKLVDPEDVLQSSFLSAWRGLDGFAYDGKGSLDRWLAKIVRNNTHGKLRELSNKVDEEMLDTGVLREQVSRSDPGPGERAGDADDRAFAEEKLNGLSAEDRALVLKHLRDRMTFTEIAAQTGADRGTVSRRFAAIMRRLSKGA